MEEDTNHQSTMSHRQAINKMGIAHFSIRHSHRYTLLSLYHVYNIFYIYESNSCDFFSQILFE